MYVYIIYIIHVYSNYVNIYIYIYRYTYTNGTYCYSQNMSLLVVSYHDNVMGSGPWFHLCAGAQVEVLREELATTPGK